MKIPFMPLQYRVGAFALGLLLLSWLFANFVLSPAQQRIAMLDNQLQEQRNYIKQIQSFSLTHPEPAKHLNQLEEKLTAFNRMLPLEPQVGEFLTQSENSAKISGVQFVSLKPGQMVNKGGYRELSLELILRGNYFQTMNFLKRIEEGPRFITVTNVTMQAQAGQIQSKISVSIYTLASGSPPSSPAQSSTGKQ